MSLGVKSIAILAESLGWLANRLLGPGMFELYDQLRERFAFNSIFLNFQKKS